MSDERDRQVGEPLEAQPVGGRPLRAEEVCMHLGISPAVLELCVRWEVIQPARLAEGEALFPDWAVERMRRGIRLHHDLGINWPGVAVILDLLERLETLEREVDARLNEL